MTIKQSQIHKSIQNLLKNKNKDIVNLAKDMIAKWKLLKKNTDKKSNTQTSNKNGDNTENKALSAEKNEENYQKILKNFENSIPIVRKIIKKNIFDALINKDISRTCKNTHNITLLNKFTNKY